MSQYGYRLNVHGNDHATLAAALRLYADKCRAEVAAGNKDPYASDLLKTENLLGEITEINAEAWGEFDAYRPKR